MHLLRTGAPTATTTARVVVGPPRLFGEYLKSIDSAEFESFQRACAHCTQLLELVRKTHRTFVLSKFTLK